MIIQYKKPDWNNIKSIFLECTHIDNIPYMKGNILKNNCIYYSDKNNTHHYTTTYLFNEVMPIISDLLKLNFNKNDFILKQNKNDINFSYHIPKKDFKCSVITSDNDVLYGMSHDILRDDNKNYLNKCPGRKTLYQTLYTFMHRCSIITMENNSKRNLLLNCDSMISPLIPIISLYFNHTVILDNREKKSHKNMYEMYIKTYTDYLCVLQTPNIKLKKEKINLM